MYTEDAHKHCKLCKNRAGDPPLRGNYIGKIQFLKFWGRKPPPLDRSRWNLAGMSGPTVPLLHAEFHLDRCNVSPLRGEKPKNRPVSKNTDRAALRADRSGKKADVFWEPMYLCTVYDVFLSLYIMISASFCVTSDVQFFHWWCVKTVLMNCFWRSKCSL